MHVSGQRTQEYAYDSGEKPEYQYQQADGGINDKQMMHTQNGEARPRPGLGEYSAHQIARALDGFNAHSFMLRNEGSSTYGTYKDRVGPVDGPNARIVAILSHRGANLDDNNTEVCHIWTKNSFIAIKHHIGQVLPFYHYSLSEGSQTLWKRFHSSFYTFKGMYRIEAYQQHEAGSISVREFVERREESQRPRPPDKWRAMLQSPWLCVRIVRVASPDVASDPAALLRVSHLNGLRKSQQF